MRDTIRPTMVANDISVTVTTPRNYAYLAVVIALQYAPVYPSKVVKSSLKRKLHPPHMGASRKESRLGATLMGVIQIQSQYLSQFWYKYHGIENPHQPLSLPSQVDF